MFLNFHVWCIILDARDFLVTRAEWTHPFPSRIRKWNAPAQTILKGQPFGKICRCQEAPHYFNCAKPSFVLSLAAITEIPVPLLDFCANSQSLARHIAMPNWVSIAAFGFICSICFHGVFMPDWRFIWMSFRKLLAYGTRSSFDIEETFFPALLELLSLESLMDALIIHFHTKWCKPIKAIVWGVRTLLQIW